MSKRPFETIFQCFPFKAPKLTWFTSQERRGTWLPFCSLAHLCQVFPQSNSCVWGTYFVSSYFFSQRLLCQVFANSHSYLHTRALVFQVFPQSKTLVSGICTLVHLRVRYFLNHRLLFQVFANLGVKYFLNRTLPFAQARPTNPSLWGPSVWLRVSWGSTIHFGTRNTQLCNCATPNWAVQLQKTWVPALVNNSALVHDESHRIPTCTVADGRSMELP